MSGGGISNNVAEIGRDAVREGIADVIGACLNELGWTMDLLSQISTIPVSTLKDARRGNITLGTEHLMRLIAVTPPHIGTLALAGTNRVLGITDPDKAQDSELLNEMLQEAAGMSTDLLDGRIDHREERKRLPGWRRLRSRLDARIRQAEAN